MIAHDICYPPRHSFCQLKLLCLLNTKAVSYFMVGTDDKVEAEVWVFADESVAVSRPGQPVKAYHTIQSVFFH